MLAKQSEKIGVFDDYKFMVLIKIKWSLAFFCDLNSNDLFFGCRLSVYFCGFSGSVLREIFLGHCLTARTWSKLSLFSLLLFMWDFYFVKDIRISQKFRLGSERCIIVHQLLECPKFWFSSQYFFQWNFGIKKIFSGLLPISNWIHRSQKFQRIYFRAL